MRVLIVEDELFLAEALQAGLRHAASVAEIPLAGEAHVWMVRDGRGAWRLDSISGEVLDPKVVAWWRAYQMNARPLPAVVIQGEVVPAIGDSVWVASWRRGTSYRNQS